MPTTPNFDAAYAPPPPKARTPAPDEVFTMAPPPRWSSNGISCFMHRNTPRRFTARTRSHSSSSRSASFPLVCSTPALLKATSSPPNSATTRSSAAFTEPESRTSMVMTRARPPAFSTSPAVSRADDSDRSATATSAPAAANATAVARPMPAPAPVTNATFPARLSLPIDHVIDDSRGKLRLRRLAAVGDHGVPGDERGGVRAQPQHRGGDLLRPTEPADRLLRDHPRVPLLGATGEPLDHRRVDDPRADGVDANARGRVVQRRVL